MCLCHGKKKDFAVTAGKSGTATRWYKAHIPVHLHALTGREQETILNMKSD